MNTKSKELADKFILLEGYIRLKIYKITIVLWKLKEFEDSGVNNPELYSEIDNTKSFLIRKLKTFNQLTLNGHIQQLSYKSDTKEEKHYIALLDYSNGEADSLGSIDINQLLKDNRLLTEENRELEKKYKQISNTLKKFLSPEELKENDVQIYIRVLKNSKKSPTYEGLEIASNKTVSKSTWDRRLKSIPFLTFLIAEMEKLINRTKDDERKNFYFEIHKKLNDIYVSKLVQDFEYKRSRGKIKFDDDKEKDILENIPDENYYSPTEFEETMEDFKR